MDSAILEKVAVAAFNDELEKSAFMSKVLKAVGEGAWKHLVKKPMAAARGLSASVKRARKISPLAAAKSPTKIKNISGPQHYVNTGKDGASRFIRTPGHSPYKQPRVKTRSTEAAQNVLHHAKRTAKAFAAPAAVGVGGMALMGRGNNDNRQPYQQ